MPSRTMRLVLTTLLVLAPLGCALAQDAAAPPTPAQKVILDTTRSFWRFRTVRQTEEVVLADGTVDHVRFNLDRDFFRKNPDKRLADPYQVQKLTPVRLPVESPADWFAPEFDDSAWIRAHGPLLRDTNDREWKLILMRGQFEVTDPARAGELRLSLAYRGGVRAYLNGAELTRAHLPKGELDLYTPGEPYPYEVYVDAEGYIMFRRGRDQAEQDRQAGRIRRLDRFPIPADRLRKGVNVLAIEIHRSPTDWRFFLGRTRSSGEVNPPHADTFWGKIGLADVTLSAGPDSSAVPNTARVPGKGLVAWNQSIVRKVFPSDYPDPFASVQPIRLSGVRNGIFAGQVVVGHDEPIRGLRATVGDLVGPGTIPAGNVQVRYAVADGASPGRERLGPFDSLEPDPPAEAPVFEESGGAIQPVWISVTVPADARPGIYRSAVTLSAEGAKPLSVPLELRVADWTLGDPNGFVARMDLVQSPESVAMAYDVPLWSDEHFRLLDRTFSLLKPLAAKTLYVTAVRRTHFGNEDAMVRWIRDEDGELAPDFSVAQKYLDVAIKHLGKVPGVILYCWEPTESMGHAGGAGGAGRTTDKPILLTLVDPQTGKTRQIKGPAWGTPESRELWTRLAKGFQAVLEKRGMADSMLFGLVGDARPTRQAMDEISCGLPKTGWAIHSHYYCVNWQGYDMGMAIALWGIGCRLADPSEGYGYGWRNAFWLSYYPREMALSSSLVEYRTKLEGWLGALSRSRSVYTKADGARGLGRLGADFWLVIKNSRGVPGASLAGRYPESYWGQLNLNYGVPHVLGKGKDGPVATVRSEAFRENIQETEARIAVERAVIDVERRIELEERLADYKPARGDRDPAKTKADLEAELAALKARKLIGDDLARRARAALDDRIRMCLHADGEGEAWFVSSGWKERTDTLFDLAAEMTRSLGTGE